MKFLGIHQAGVSIPYSVQFHDDSNTTVDPTVPAARLRKPDDTFSDLTAPAKLDAKPGWYGGSIDTTGLSQGTHEVRVSGTVDGHEVATALSFQVDAPPAGARVWKIHLEAPAGTVLPAAFVSIRNDADDTILEAGVTDSNGEVTFSVPDGNYNVHVSALARAKYSNPTPITISADATTNITGVPFSPIGSATPDECVVSIWIEGAGSAYTITARLDPMPQQQDPVILLKDKTAVFQTDHYEIILPRNSTWLITLPPETGGKQDKYTVPDQASVNLVI